MILIANELGDWWVDHNSVGMAILDTESMPEWQKSYIFAMADVSSWEELLEADKLDDLIFAYGKRAEAVVM